MAAVREQMHFTGHARVDQRLVVQQAVLHRHHAVVLRVHQEGRRCLRGNLGLLGELPFQRGTGPFAEQAGARTRVRMRAHVDHRVQKQGEVRARADRVHGVTDARERGGESGAQPRGHVAAGGEAHHPDPVRVQLPPARIAADQAQGALGVSQRRLAVITAGRQAVPQHEQGHSALLHEGRHQRSAFLVQHDALVATAGNDQQRAAVGPGRAIGHQVRRTDVVDVAVRKRAVVAAFDDVRRAGRTRFTRDLTGRPQVDAVWRAGSGLGLRHWPFGRIGRQRDRGEGGKQAARQQGHQHETAHPGILGMGNDRVPGAGSF